MGPELQFCLSSTSMKRLLSFAYVFSHAPSSKNIGAVWRKHQEVPGGEKQPSVGLTSLMFSSLWNLVSSTPMLPGSPQTLLPEWLPDAFKYIIKYLIQPP